MSTKICRLCLNDTQLIDIFDVRSTNSERLRKCILLATGIEIRREDRVTKYICEICSQIAVSLYKYRKKAVANDKALKEFANQDFVETDADNIEFLNNIIFESLTATTENVEKKKNKIKSTITKLRQESKKFVVHPSVMQVIKSYPDITLPNDVMKWNIHPKVIMTYGEIKKWKFKRRPRPKSVQAKYNAMQIFKLKCPGINIMKIAPNSENNSDITVTKQSSLLKNPGPSYTIPKVPKIRESTHTEIKLSKTEASTTTKPSKTTENKHILLKIPKRDATHTKTRLLKTTDTTKKLSKTETTQTATILQKTTETAHCSTNLPKQNESTDISRKRKLLQPSSAPRKKQKIKETSTSTTSTTQDNNSTKKKVPKLKLLLKRPSTAEESNNSTNLQSIVSDNFDSVINTEEVDTLRPEEPQSVSIHKHPSETVNDAEQITSREDVENEIHTEQVVPLQFDNNQPFDSDPNYSDLDNASIGDYDISEDLLETVEEEVVLHCDYCNKLFNTKQQLKVHERVHRHCTICKAIFRSAETLRYHQTEVCFKTLIANPPKIELMRVDQEPDIVKLYPEVVPNNELDNSVLEQPSESVNIEPAQPTNTEITNNLIENTEVLSISDDEGNDDVVFVKDFPPDLKILTSNKEFKYVCNVFRKYKKVKLPQFVSNAHAQTKPQISVKYNAKNQIVVENLNSELQYYRIPVEFACKPTSFAYVSYDKTEVTPHEIYSWKHHKVRSLHEKTPVNIEPLKPQNPLTGINPANSIVNNSVCNNIVTQKTPNNMCLSDSPVNSSSARHTTQQFNTPNSALQPTSSASSLSSSITNKTYTLNTVQQISASNNTTDLILQQKKDAITPTNTRSSNFTALPVVQETLCTPNSTLPQTSSNISSSNSITSSNCAFSTASELTLQQAQVLTTTLPGTEQTLHKPNIAVQKSVSDLLDVMIEQARCASNSSNISTRLLNGITSIPNTMRSFDKFSTYSAPPSYSVATSTTSYNRNNAGFNNNVLVTDNYNRFVANSVPAHSSNFQSQTKQSSSNGNASLRVKAPWELNTLK